MMKYQELYNEYNTLLSDQAKDQEKLKGLVDGYISIKTIADKQYFYLQKRVGGKLKSEYIKSELFNEIKTQLEERKRLEFNINLIDGELTKLESAISILSPSLSQKVLIAKQCAKMDIMDIEKRKKALDFADAMTALEGIPASEEVKSNLAAWAQGKQSFKEGYLEVLEKYNMIEV